MAALAAGAPGAAMRDPDSHRGTSSLRRTRHASSVVSVTYPGVASVGHSATPTVPADERSDTTIESRLLWTNLADRCVDTRGTLTRASSTSKISRPSMSLSAIPARTPRGTQALGTPTEIGDDVVCQLRWSGRTITSIGGHEPETQIVRRWQRQRGKAFPPPSWRHAVRLAQSHRPQRRAPENRSNDS